MRLPSSSAFPLADVYLESSLSKLGRSALPEAPVQLARRRRWVWRSRREGRPS